MRTLPPVVGLRQMNKDLGSSAPVTRTSPPVAFCGGIGAVAAEAALHHADCTHACFLLLVPLASRSYGDIRASLYLQKIK
jgi:hypothetical protein